MLDLFTSRENIYNLRNLREFCEKKKTIRYGTGTVTYKAAQLGELLTYIKNSPTLTEFKENKNMEPR